VLAARLGPRLADFPYIALDVAFDFGSLLVRKCVKPGSGFISMPLLFRVGDLLSDLWPSKYPKVL
jgi:hypothetical protein